MPYANHAPNCPQIARITATGEQQLHGNDCRPCSCGGVLVLRVPKTTAEQEWKVQWRGIVCTPSWLTRGPAEAYLDMLRSGTREPEY